MIGATKSPLETMQDAIQGLLLAENASNIAHAKRSMYEAYLSEGFTETQALELTKVFGGGFI